MPHHYTIETFSAAQLQAHIDELANLLHANVSDGASVSFILPFSLTDAANFWQQKVKPSLEQDVRILLVAKVDDEVAGCVMLDFDMPPNQPHRAEIAKLLVNPKFRRRGIARALMIEIEQQAMAKNFKLLVLDTANDSAENLYKSLGYIVSGCIPNFALSVHSAQLEPTIIMYRSLK